LETRVLGLEADIKDIKTLLQKLVEGKNNQWVPMKPIL
jgi:hypothetical protein